MLLIRTSLEGRRGSEVCRCREQPPAPPKHVLCFDLNPSAWKTLRKTLPTRTDFKRDQATQIWGGVRMFGCNFWSRLLCTARQQQQQQREPRHVWSRKNNASTQEDYHNNFFMQIITKRRRLCLCGTEGFKKKRKKKRGHWRCLKIIC